MNGIELAKMLKLQTPKINIIFTTGYSEYTGDAFALHASGYVMKPITAEKIMVEIEDLRNPVAIQSGRKTIQVHTFGNFEVYIDDVPATFHTAKQRNYLRILWIGKVRYAPTKKL